MLWIFVFECINVESTNQGSQVPTKYLISRWICIIFSCSSIASGKQEYIVMSYAIQSQDHTDLSHTDIEDSIL